MRTINLHDSITGHQWYGQTVSSINEVVATAIKRIRQINETFQNHTAPTDRWLTYLNKHANKPLIDFFHRKGASMGIVCWQTNVGPGSK